MASPDVKRSNRVSKSCNMNMAHGGEGEEGGEKLQHKKHQSFARGLTLSNFSKSFVTLQCSLTRIVHLSPRSHFHSQSHAAPGSPICDSPRGSETSACSTPTSVSSASSCVSHGSSTPTTPTRRSHYHAKRPTCVGFHRRHGHSKRSKSMGAGAEERRPVLLEKIPSGKSGEEYITVYVGNKRTQRVKYVISRDLLSHHLFQVLLKCSEDEFGQEYSQKGGIAIICDPALFLQVVRVVDDSMRETQGKGPSLTEDGDSSYYSDEVSARFL